MRSVQLPPYRRAVANTLATALIAISAFIGVGIGAQTAEAVADDDWLGIVNTYRQMSGLSPITSNATWSAEAKAHSSYMLRDQP